jgi:hypothetical protein
MVSGIFSPIATSANCQAAFCNVCGERFAVWSRKGCADHTYAMGFNLEFKGARDHWPAAKFQQLISEESEAKLDAPELIEHDFQDVIPPFLGGLPSPEHEHRFGQLCCVPRHEWRTD